MTTREEMAEACAVLRVRCPCPVGDQKELCHECQCMDEAEDQLKRDGELRERLANLCATARTAGHPEAAALAAHVEALLKEFP